MKVLHIAPHLGGGVGKAHAAMAEAAALATPAGAPVHSYALLEAPRDRAYAERITAAGCAIHVAPDRAALQGLAAEADIVQLEWWNHPRLFAMLVNEGLPEARLLAWVHISGLRAPLVPRLLVEALDRTLFSSPCSFEAETLRTAILRRPESFGLVNSGFGFKAVSRSPRRPGTPLRFAYLGTVDFMKMHPRFFDLIDALESDIRLDLWGTYDPDGEPARRAAAMRHPHRVRFMGYASDPAAVLARTDVFVYLLGPDHYGTGENALVEAMSAGAVPITFANPAEAAIVDHGRTGYVVTDGAAFATCVAELLAHPDRLARLRKAAMATVARNNTPEVSLRTLHSVYGELMRSPKRRRDFTAALGLDARAWFLSSQSARAGAPLDGDARFMSRIPAKGSIGHFLSCFPQDPSLAASARALGHN